MNGASAGRNPGNGWPATLAVAVLFLWGGPARCATPSARSQPRPLVESTLAPISTPPAEGLPSTVSPSIARFMQGSGRYLPPPKPLDVLAATRTRQEIDFTKPGTTVPSTAIAAPSLPADRPAAPAASPRTAESRRLASAAPSLDRSFTLKSAPTDPKDLRFRINLATALRLSDARPLVVAAAQAGAWASEAELARAKVLWVPTANIGFDYIRHDGGGPDFNKGIMTAPSVNYFMGGAGADLYINTADAIFEPLAARRMLDSANYDIQTAKNDVLFQTADAYFRVHQYRGMYSGALYTVEKGADLLARVRQLAKELVPKDEIDRAQSMLSDLEQRAASARQEWRVASADLTQILRLDPRAVVVPLEHDHVQITLIDPARDLNELMPIALNHRPELGSRLAIVEAAEIRVRREKLRPALPLVMVDGFQHASMLLQAGIFGLGPNNSLNQFTGRSDVSLQLMWQLEAFGLGNLARVKRQRSEQSQSIIDLRQTQDMIAADVTRALARVQSGAARVQQADRALRTGIITFNGHLEGLEQTRRLGNLLILTFRPQEAVYSLDLLSVAFNEYFTTVAEYNRAQFELFHALGYPAQEIAALRAPGEILPVNTTRPGFLPPVGHGPPPATR